MKPDSTAEMTGKDFCTSSGVSSGTITQHPITVFIAVAFDNSYSFLITSFSCSIVF